jgi:hypothetical protein
VCLCVRDVAGGRGQAQMWGGKKNVVFQTVPKPFQKKKIPLGGLKKWIFFCLRDATQSTYERGGQGRERESKVKGISQSYWCMRP